MRHHNKQRGRHNWRESSCKTGEIKGSPGWVKDEPSMIVGQGKRGQPVQIGSGWLQRWVHWGLSSQDAWCHEIWGQNDWVNRVQILTVLFFLTMVDSCPALPTMLCCLGLHFTPWQHSAMTYSWQLEEGRSELKSRKRRDHPPSYSPTSSCWSCSTWPYTIVPPDILMLGSFFPWIHTWLYPPTSPE